MSTSKTAAFDHARKTFAGAMDPTTRAVNTEAFLAVCDAIGGIYQAMFMEMIASQLKGDVDNSANNVKIFYDKNRDRCLTIQDLVKEDLRLRTKEEVRNDRSSGTVALLWAKRNVNFVVMYVELLGKFPDITAGECAQQTYAKILMPYHGWVTSTFVSTVMGLAPAREEIYLRLGLNALPDPILAIKDFVDQANPVLAEIQKTLELNECDFDDQV